MEKAIITRGHFEKPNQIILDEEIRGLTGNIEIIIRQLPEKKVLRKAGTMKGKIKLEPDFDAPLDDFQEYM